MSEVRIMTIVFNNRPNIEQHILRSNQPVECLEVFESVVSAYLAEVIGKGLRGDSNRLNFITGGFELLFCSLQKLDGPFNCGGVAGALETDSGSDGSDLEMKVCLGAGNEGGLRRRQQKSGDHR